jgi:predicted amidophosphoribosyltransferase
MCGCMLMHAAMNHEGHQRSTPQSGAPAPASAAVSSTRRTCAHCGFPLQEGFAFCPNCGMSLQAKCPACGQKVDLSWATCTFCGSPLGETQKHAAHH